MAQRAGGEGRGSGRKDPSRAPEQRQGGVSRQGFPEGPGASKRGDPPIEERHGPRSRHGNVDRPPEGA